MSPSKSMYDNPQERKSILFITSIALAHGMLSNPNITDRTTPIEISETALDMAVAMLAKVETLP